MHVCQSARLSIKIMLVTLMHRLIWVYAGHLCQNIVLILSMLGKKFSKLHFEISVLFFLETGFDISCKLTPKETIYMKYQRVFSSKSKTITML